MKFKQNKFLRKNKGVALLELLIAITAMAIMASIGIAQLKKFYDGYKVDNAAENILEIKKMFDNSSINIENLDSVSYEALPKHLLTNNSSNQYFITPLKKEIKILANKKDDKIIGTTYFIKNLNVQQCIGLGNKLGKEFYSLYVTSNSEENPNYSNAGNEVKNTKKVNEKGKNVILIEVDKNSLINKCNSHSNNSQLILKSYRPFDIKKYIGSPYTNVHDLSIEQQLQLENELQEHKSLIEQKNK